MLYAMLCAADASTLLPCSCRKPSDLPPHLDDILAAKPKAVWLQSGITNPEFEQALAAAGIQVVSDRCLMVDHRRAVSNRSAL